MSSAAVQEMSESFRGLDTVLPDVLVATIADRHVDGLLSATKTIADAESAARAQETRVAEGNAQIRAELRRTYGPQGGEQLLERTTRFVRQHPALAKILQQNGLGSRPDIVSGIAAHVFSTGWR